jgi:hypothetical protein
MDGKRMIWYGHVRQIMIIDCHARRWNGVQKGDRKGTYLDERGLEIYDIFTWMCYEDYERMCDENGPKCGEMGTGCFTTTMLQPTQL